MANTGKLPALDAVSPETQALVERCRRGEREAQAVFYRTYRHDVSRTLHRILGPGHDEVEDLVQEVFIEAFRSIVRFRGDARVTTWLYRVCVNVALGRLRKRRRRHEVSYGDPPERGDEQTPQRTVEAQERMRMVYGILDELAPKKRVVFVLHEIEGYEPREIAAIVGANALTVRTRLHYARKEFYARASQVAGLGDGEEPAGAHDAGRWL